MKSPLVKALSHASDGDAASDQLADKSTAVAEGHQLSELDELQLMDATHVLNVDDEVGKEFAETAKLSTDQPANEDADVVVRDVGHASAIAVNTLASRRLWIRRLGIYSPIVCVVFAVAASACYFTYQKLGGWNQNTDLQALSNQSRAFSNSADHSEIDIDTDQNPFNLLVGSPASSLPSSSSPASVIDRPGTARPVSTGKQRPVVVKMNNSSIDDKAFATLNEAFDAYERGDYEQSELAYRRALALAPRHPNALHGLAAILHRTGRFDESRQFYESLLSVEPGNTAAAAALLAGGNQAAHAANESEIKQMIQRHPNSAGLQFALGQLMARQSRWANARDLFANAVRLDGGNADYLFNLAISLEHLGLYSEARRIYESALASSNASSTLDSDIVVARIESLAAHSTAENEAQ